MVQLRPLTIIFLCVTLPLAGYVSAVGVYSARLTRVQEERAVYSDLATGAVALSERSFLFAQDYQKTLDICLTRLYAKPLETLVTLPVVKKGGIGGPLDVRRNNRLP